MDTFITVISFPFWFFGIVTMLSAIGGTIMIAGERIRPNDYPVRIAVFFIGVMVTSVAYIMVSL